MEKNKNYLTIGLIPIAFVLFIIGVYFLGRQSVQIDNNQIAIYPTPTTVEIVPTVTVPTTAPKITQAPTISPSKFGLTKSIEMPAIGVKGLFPQNAILSLQDTQFYTISLGNLNTALTFKLSDYDGTGRRAWFQNHYPYAKNYTFEEFSKGYLAYATKPSDLPGNIFYFAVVSNTKMLVIEDLPQNGFDLPKFKAHISTLTISTPQVVAPVSVNPDVFRTSGTNITLWSDESLGLKIVGPTWTESRAVKSRDSEGNFTYYEWYRSIPKANINGDTVSIFGASGYNIQKLDTKYSTYTFESLINELLFPSGFCATEQKVDDVRFNLELVKELKIGELSAQLRRLNKSYNDLYDCRADVALLVKAKNGQYITSSIYSDGTVFKLERL